MIRLIVKRRQTCRISGLDREWFETFDADLPEVERALGGGFGENGSLAGSVIGAEVITELPQDAGDGARVTEAEFHKAIVSAGLTKRQQGYVMGAFRAALAAREGGAS